MTYKPDWTDYEYRYICTAHNDIIDFVNKILDLLDISKSMGINMEHALNTKNEKIKKLTEEIDKLKEKNTKLRERNKLLNMKLVKNRLRKDNESK